MSNLRRFIKQTVYSLKRDFGLPINLVWSLSSVPDLKLGTKTVTKDSLTVNRGIVLPADVERTFVYDLSFIASNKNFTYGGLFNTRSRKIIFDSDDLPSDFEIKVGYYLIFSGKRYEIKTSSEFEGGWFLTAEQIDNIDLENHVVKHHYTYMPLEQTVEVTVE